MPRIGDSKPVVAPRVTDPKTPAAPKPAEATAPPAAAGWGPKVGGLKSKLGGLVEGIEKKLDKVATALDTVGDLVRAGIDSSGLDGKGVEDWKKRSDRLGGLVRSSSIAAGSGVDSPAFAKEFERLTNSHFTTGNSTKLLPDGPAAWEERKQAINSATSDIKMMTWAFYDDDTGKQTAQLLIDKAKQGVSVSVMADFDVAQHSGHRQALAMLEKAAAEGLPINVHRWENPQHTAQGQHMKYLVIDSGKQVIAGGRNPGDVYYERGTKAAWKDTEVQVTGPAAGEMNRAFVNEWNSQAKLHDGMKTLADDTKMSGPTGSGRTAVIEHVPGGDESNITMATLSAIRASKTSFHMANAYLLSLPAVREELKAAAARGVDVRVMTNSSDTIDETAISAPILETVKELSDAGVKMYLQKSLQPTREGTNTLHSKYWVADGQLTSVQSHNEHPRSDYYEREIAMVSLDGAAGKALEADFNTKTGAGNATTINSPEDVKIPDDLMSRFKARLIKGLFLRQS